MTQRRGLPRSALPARDRLDDILAGHYGKRPRKASKYGNTRTTYNGHTYDSKAEAEYAGTLDRSVLLGIVTSWRPQVVLRCEVNGQHICDYRADFEVRYPDGSVRYVDVKGVRTAAYLLKRKLVQACLGVVVVEVDA